MNIVVMAILTLLTCQRPAPGQTATQYTYEDLGTLAGGGMVSPFAINASGQVVGYAVTKGYSHAFLKSPGHPIQDLGTLPGVPESFARGISGSGQIVGNGSGGSEGWFKNPGEPMQPIPESWIACGINDGGQIIGGANDHAFLKNPGQPIQDLGTLPGFFQCRATAINASGQIVGCAADEGNDNKHAFFKNPGQPMQDLGNGGGVWNSCEPASINASGQIVGYLERSEFQNSLQHAFLKNPGQPIQDLGTLPEYRSSWANGINASGQIVGGLWELWDGSHEGVAFLKNPGEPMQDLNNLVVNLPAGVSLKNAAAINDKGQITGSVKILSTGNEHGFLLTPIPVGKAMPCLQLLLD